MAPHGHGLLGVVEVADLAWDAYELWEGRREQNQQHHLCLQLQSDLSQQRSQNVRLRALLQEIQDIVSNDADSDSDSASPPDLCKKLQAAMESLKSMENLDEQGKENSSANPKAENLVSDDLQSWQYVQQNDMTCKKEEICGLDTENFVIIDDADIVEGIAFFMGEVIVKNPRSKKLSPEQLQEAISKVLAKMDRSKTAKNLWTLTKVLYTLLSWGITLYGLYTTRHIIKAAAKVGYKSGKAVYGALT